MREAQGAWGEKGRAAWRGGLEERPGEERERRHWRRGGCGAPRAAGPAPAGPGQVPPGAGTLRRVLPSARGRFRGTGFEGGRGGAGAAGGRAAPSRGLQQHLAGTAGSAAAGGRPPPASRGRPEGWAWAWEREGGRAAPCQASPPTPTPRPSAGISLIMWNALYTAEKAIIRWTLLAEACYFAVQFLGEHPRGAGGRAGQGSGAGAQMGAGSSGAEGVKWGLKELWGEALGGRAGSAGGERESQNHRIV